MWTMDSYQAAAMRTNGTKGDVEMLNNAALGLAGEAGEFADHVKKILFHGHPINRESREQIIKELGDIQWYLAQAAEALHVHLDTIATRNIEKLAVRYPDGFDCQHSLFRKETDE